MRFSNKIAILIAALIILSGIIQFFTFDRFFLATTDSLLLSINQKAADNMNKILSSYFEKTKDLLQSIAVDARMRENQESLDRVNTLIPEINTIFILDAQGNVLLASGAKPAPGLNVAKRDYFQHAMQGETYISNVFTSADNRQVVSIATPIKEEGKVTGVVLANIWLQENYLASMFNDKSFGRNGAITILDSQGIVIYHPERERIGKQAVIFDALAGNSGTVVMDNYSGQENYVGYSRTGFNWLVAVLTPTAELKELRHMMIYQIVAVALITIFLASALGLYTLRRYMKPFEKLVRAFSSLREGKYIEIPRSEYTNEFGEMEEAYNLTVRKLEELHNQLRGAADIDGLTGTYNRRAFDQTLVALSAEMQAGSLKNVGILFLDLDNFKELNDTQGHLAGDDVLKDFTAIVRSVVEPRTLFRYGGDEFVIVLRNLPRSTILVLAEELRLRCTGVLRGSTLSVGIATSPENSQSLEELVVLADKALYMSKETKNKVTAYPV